MTTFGNPHEQYTPQTTRSNKERKQIKSNQKDVKSQKKRKSHGQSVNKSPSNTTKSGRKSSSRKQTEEEKEGDEDEDENTAECPAPDIAFAGFNGLPGFAQILVTLAALGQLLVGLIHIIELWETLEDTCDDRFTDVECVGDSLFWDYPGVDGTDSLMNIQWRLVFTFAPTGIYYFGSYVGGGFCDNWTPVIFGVLAILQIFVSTQWHFISGTWLRTTFFIVVMMLFACFGYSGMVGIIIGFVQAIAGFLCLLCAVFKLGGSPFPTIGY